jgi:GNAT superfamily N-acetyltransferase
MIHYTHYENQSDPFVSGGSLSRFLHAHLEQYGDEVTHIQKAINYVFEHGGHITVQYLEGKPSGAAVVNHTRMGGYIPENILVYIAVRNDLRGMGLGRQLMKELMSAIQGDIALHVEAQNPAKRLYESLGFTNPYLEMRLKRT